MVPLNKTEKKAKKKQKGASNIVLIGMPGSGKSTCGKKLASRLSKTFVDTDKLIEQHWQMDLQQLLNRRGTNGLKKAECDIVSNLHIKNSIIATGGSVAMSQQAMQHLSSIGFIVFFNISLPSMLKRVNNSDQRGLLKLPNQSLQQLYFQRMPYYQRWADVVVDNNAPLTELRSDRIVQQITGVIHG